jgi:lipid II isoglutaminyl synthase (glutamine-hydrolysing)
MWIVSKSIRLAALYPNHLNLNGDLANLLVLQKRLEWYGLEADVVYVEKTTDLTKFDVVLLGHGSRDAWAQLEAIDPELIPSVASLVAAGKKVMAVSSGYELLIEAIDGLVVKHSERVSEFRSHEEIVGYVNSEAELEPIRWINDSLFTLFHGPVFAKNPDLADKFLGSLITGLSATNEHFSKISQLAEVSRKTAFED